MDGSALTRACQCELHRLSVPLPVRLIVATAARVGITGPAADHDIIADSLEYAL